MVQAKHSAEEVQAESLFDRLREINQETGPILKEARSARNHAIALQAIGRAERQIELEARLLKHSDVFVGSKVEPQPTDYDLSLLTDEELDQLITLTKKMLRQP